MYMRNYDREQWRDEPIIKILSEYYLHLTIKTNAYERVANDYEIKITQRVPNQLFFAFFYYWFTINLWVIYIKENNIVKYIIYIIELERGHQFIFNQVFWTDRRNNEDDDWECWRTRRPIQRQDVPFGRLCHVEKIMLMIRAKGGARSSRFSTTRNDVFVVRPASKGQAWLVINISPSHRCYNQFNYWRHVGWVCVCVCM